MFTVHRRRVNWKVRQEQVWREVGGGEKWSARSIRGGVDESGGHLGKSRGGGQHEESAFTSKLGEHCSFLTLTYTRITLHMEGGEYKRQKGQRGWDVRKVVQREDTQPRLREETKQIKGGIYGGAWTHICRIASMLDKLIRPRLNWLTSSIGLASKMHLRWTQVCFSADLLQQWLKIWLYSSSNILLLEIGFIKVIS